MPTCGFEFHLGDHYKIINLKSDVRHNPNMTTLDEDRDIAETADKVIAYTGNLDSQRTAMLAAFRLFHSIGYRRRYGDVMDDAVKGKDRRAKAHLN